MRNPRAPGHIPEIPRIGDTAVKPVRFGFRYKPDEIDAQDTVHMSGDVEEVQKDKPALRTLRDWRLRQRTDVTRLDDMRFSQDQLEATSRLQRKSLDVNLGTTQESQIKPQKFKTKASRRSMMTISTTPEFDLEVGRQRPSKSKRQVQARKAVSAGKAEKTIDPFTAQRTLLQAGHMSLRPRTPISQSAHQIALAPKVKTSSKVARMALRHYEKTGRIMTDQELSVMLRKERPRRTKARHRPRVDGDMEEITGRQGRARQKRRHSAKRRASVGREEKVISDYRRRARPRGEKSRARPRAGRDHTEISGKREAPKTSGREKLSIRPKAARELPELAFVPVGGVKPPSRKPAAKISSATLPSDDVVVIKDTNVPDFEERIVARLPHVPAEDDDHITIKVDRQPKEDVKVVVPPIDKDEDARISMERPKLIFN